VSFGEGYGYHPVYQFCAAAVVLQRVSKWLDAGAYDVVIGERHRELLDEHRLGKRLRDQQRVPAGANSAEYHPQTTINGLLFSYLENCPEWHEADDPAGILMEILSREQDASYIEANGLKGKALSIVLGHHASMFHLYRRDGEHMHKVSDECARRGIYKLRKNKTLWALLIEEPTFLDSLKDLKAF
jgi:hypothetical protein